MEKAEGIAHYGSCQHNMINNKLKLSKEALNISGYLSGETVISYEKKFARIHPTDADKLQDLVNNISSNPHHTGYKDSFRLIDDNGKYRVVKVEFVLRYNLSRKLLRINGFVQELTEPDEFAGYLEVDETNPLKQEIARTEDAMYF